MKNIILMFVLFFGIVGYSQKKDTPKYYIVEKDTLGIIISIPDAQKLDNDGDILKIYEQLSIDYGKSSTQYIVILNGLQQQIGVLKIERDKYKNIITDKDVVIADLKKIITNNELTNSSYQKELSNKNTELKNLKKQVNRSFWQKIGGSAVALVVIGFLLIK